MTELFSSSQLIDLIEKVVAGERLSFNDGVRLFNSHDLLAIGYMADIIRKRKNGKKVYFVSNRHINHFNICQKPFEVDKDSPTSTMLYGHIETIEERVEHLLQLRELQDQTGGFLTFAPMAFPPQHTALEDQVNDNRTTGFDDVKMLSIARILLDNFDHVKAYWMLIGPKLAQVSLGFGVDDLDGTVVEEKITHAAGAESSQAISRQELVHIIKSAGYEPIERDTLYRVVRRF